MRTTRLILCLALAATGLRAATGGSVRVEIKDPKGGAVGDAVAFMVPLDREPTLTPPADPVVIVQNNEDFQTYVTAVVVGTRVSFPNRDKVQHHVYSQSKSKPFNIPRYRGEPKELILFDQPGVVTLGCNLHDWMVAYVVVLATPHFATSGTDGMGSVTGLPAGRYRLEVWHPRVPENVKREVTIGSDSAATQVIAVTLNPDRRIRRAPEGAGGGYK